MSKEENYKDVNREQYLKAMFTELIGQSAMTHFSEKAKLIHDFTLANSMKSSSHKGTRVQLTTLKDVPDEVDATGNIVVEGKILIPPRTWKDKTIKKKIDKILKGYKKL